MARDIHSEMLRTPASGTRRTRSAICALSIAISAYLFSSAVHTTLIVSFALPDDHTQVETCPYQMHLAMNYCYSVALPLRINRFSNKTMINLNITLHYNTL